MGCCGRKTPKPAAKTSTARVVKEVYNVGVEGMVLVSFVPDIGAPKTFYGPVTHAAYRFGGRRKVGRVDKRDLRTGSARNPGFLEMWEGKRQIFKETVDPGKAPPKKVISPPEEFQLAEAVGEIPDPSSMTVKELRELSGKLSPDEWKALREAELNGKSRASALKFMDTAIDNLE